MGSSGASPTVLMALLSAAVFLVRTAALMLGPLLVALAAAFHTSVPVMGQLAAAINLSWGITARLEVRSDQLARLEAWEREPAFNEHERAVIRYTAEATQQVTVASATFDALRGFLDDQQILELVLNVGFYNMVVRVLVPLEVELEADAHENRYRLDHQPQAPGHDR